MLCPVEGLRAGHAQRVAGNVCQCCSCASPKIPIRCRIRYIDRSPFSSFKHAKLGHAPPAEAVTRSLGSMFLVSPRSNSGKPGTSPTVSRFETAASEAAVCCCGPIVLGGVAADLAWVAAGVGFGAAGDRGPLAPSRLQSVLDMAFPAPSSRGQEVPSARELRCFDLPHGCRKLDLGRAAHPW